MIITEEEEEEEEAAAAAAAAAATQHDSTLWLDNARAFAVFAVIVIHVAAPLTLDEAHVGSFDWWTGNIYVSLALWCVPVFVMLSGALLLDRDREASLSQFYRKRASRVLIPLLFWSLFYTAKTALAGIAAGEDFSAYSLAVKLLSGNPSYHMWFIYMIVGLYVFTPFLRKIARQSSRHELVFLTCLLFVMAAITQALLTNSGAAEPPDGDLLWIDWFLLYLPYFLAGYLINTAKATPDVRMACLVLLLAAAFASIGYLLLTKNSGLLKGRYFYQYLSVPVIPMALSAMIILRRVSAPIISSTVSARLAQLSLGIYLIHVLFIEAAGYFGLKVTSFNPALSVPIISVLVFAVSLAAAQSIRLIPYLRRTI